MDLDSLEKIAAMAMDDVRIHRFPEQVPGRVLHADADVFSYKACDIEYSYAQNVQELKTIIDVWRKLAGAQKIVLHLTMGTKGGREEIARVKKYQGKRVKPDHDKQERVADLREWMANVSEYNHIIPFPNFKQEADDSMCQAMWMAKDNPDLDYVLFSPDKDLWMVGGKHIDKDTFEIQEFPWGYGSTHVAVDSSGKKKIKGKGTSWFWHQMLMGDQADNIPGLPYLSKDLVVKHVPSKAMLDLQKRISSGRMPNGKLMNHNQKATALDKYHALFNKQDAKLLGPILAQRYLQNCGTDQAAYHTVLDAYKGWYGKANPQRYPFFSWDNVRIEATPYEMFLEQARLLWMRRTENQDVEEWFQEILK